MNNLSKEGFEKAAKVYWEKRNSKAEFTDMLSSVLEAYLPFHSTGQADNSELLARGIEWLDEGRAPHPYKGLVTYDLIKDLVAALTPPNNQKGE